MLDDHVNAPPLGVLPRLLRDLHRLVVHGVVGSELDRLPELGVVPSRRDDVGVVGLRNLDGRYPDAGAGPKDHHRLTRLDLGLRHEHVVGRQEDQRDGGRLDEVHPPGLGKDVPGRDHDELGVSPIGLVPDDGVAAALVVHPAEAPLALPAPDPRAHDDLHPLSKLPLVRGDLLDHP